MLRTAVEKRACMSLSTLSIGVIVLVLVELLIVEEPLPVGEAKR
jgi:hypothetical protein